MVSKISVYSRLQNTHVNKATDSLQCLFQVKMYVEVYFCPCTNFNTVTLVLEQIKT